MDINAMRAMIEQQKTDEIKQNENKKNDVDDVSNNVPYPADAFSIDFNSPQMIGLTDEMANLFTEKNGRI
eukprot:UN01770